MAMPVVEDLSVGCRAASCAGKNPVAQGCTDDSIVLESRYTDPLRVARAQLGFSPTCNAAWVRGDGTNPGFNCIFPIRAQVQHGIYSPSRDEIVVADTQGVVLHHELACEGGSKRSLMVSAGPGSVRLRVLHGDGSPDVYPWH